MTAHLNQPGEDLSSCAPEDRDQFLEIIDGLRRVLGEDSLKYACFFEAVFLKPSPDKSNASMPVSGDGVYGSCDPGQMGLLSSPESPVLATATARSWRSDARV